MPIHNTIQYFCFIPHHFSRELFYGGNSNFLVLGEVMVCVLDFKRDVGLWHGVLTVSESLISLCFIGQLDISNI